MNGKLQIIQPVKRRDSLCVRDTSWPAEVLADWPAM